MARGPVRGDRVTGQASLTETIAAISTPPGAGGIGIVRLSGPQALAIADRIFRGRSQPSQCETFTVHYGHIVDGEEVLEECLLTTMRAPHTYTREDVVEINCHSGPAVLRAVLDLTLRHGARLAEPGEFTKRAFLHGRIDLAQAEAVLDLINAQTDLSRRAALSQLEGRLSQRVTSIRERLIDLLAHLEAALDFTDDDIEIISPADQQARLEEIRAELRALAASADAGQILREGLSAVIAGRPNVGKSSLMNALLRTNRVIVTPIPGTTRDAIEEMVNLRGVPVRLVDTAGLRESEDVLEREGVDRSRRWLERADLILLVLDRAEPLRAEDRAALAELNGRKAVIVLNKSDLPAHLEEAEVTGLCPETPQVVLSALTGEGVDRLEEAILRLVWGGQVEASTPLVTNVRHQRALVAAAESLERALATLQQGWSEELVAVDVQAALQQVGEIVGETSTEEVINYIFEAFCIGK